MDAAKTVSAHSIVQLGLGGVGQALVRQYLGLREGLGSLGYAALGDRSGLLWLAGGWTPDDLSAALSAKAQRQQLSAIAAGFGERTTFVAAGPSGLPAVELPGTGASYIVVDVTAERNSYDAVLQARQQGANVVLCNKWALAEPMPSYTALMAGSGRLRYETTVGAALPVIAPLEHLLQTGDTVERIEAAISGTLGFVCSEIEHGVPFSAALIDAQRRGFTEPDPRDDLAGIDARRKALILARKLGQSLDMNNVVVDSLVPAGLESVSLDEFWRRLPEADAAYAARVTTAAAQDNVLRFLATIDGDGARIALTEVPLNSPAGALKGTESLFIYHTRRYADQPLTIRGRGAGADITASGVLADILEIAACST